MSKKHLLFFFISIYLCFANVYSQRRVWSSSDIVSQVEKLDVLGSVLYFAAHPDDENTRLIAWLAQEKKYRTGYLSLTRGEGGQNLLGTDLGIDLGLTRTNELLAARGIDMGEQFFSSAYDFGFSKTHEETFKFWDHEVVLGEAVYIIRKFRPDVIITRFPPDKRGGHGHHQASAILAHEAFLAAGDPKKFPEQLVEVQVWKPTRLVWNTANFGGINNTSDEQLKIEIGHYNPILGLSYGEIASKSRSQHKSQGFGSASSRGQSVEYFEHVAGKKAKNALLDDVNTSWSRLKGTENIQSLTRKIKTSFDPKNPGKIVADLFSLRKAIQVISNDYWKIQKAKEIEDLIVACSGIWVDVFTDVPTVPVSTTIPLQVEVIFRNADNPVRLLSVAEKPIAYNLALNTLWKETLKFNSDRVTQPYWLEKPNTLGKFVVEQDDIGKPLNTDNPSVNIVFEMCGEQITICQPINYRYVDPVQGELHQPLAVIPAITALLSSNNFLNTQNIPITFQRNDISQSHFTIAVDVSKGWAVEPSTINLNFDNENIKDTTLSFRKISAGVREKPVINLSCNNQPIRSIKKIRYDHIPSITWFPRIHVNLEIFDLENPNVRRVGYIHGAGDLIPESLNNIGIEVSTLLHHQIQLDYLKQFDAIVIGVRYFNVDEKSEIALSELLQYVEQGGVVVVQYNVNGKLNTSKLGPYPFSLSRDRVTEEDAFVHFDKENAVFNYPNKITDRDFDNWVQERGLYFATNIDKRYRSPIKMKDTDEPFNDGSLLITKYGRGKFVYTSLSFFRQLPAGVPGAYRLFVNLLTKEK